MKRNLIDIIELRRRNLAHVTFSDLFHVDEGKLTPDEIGAVNAYLHRFALLRDDDGTRCPGCNAILTRKDAVSGFLLGATFEWGLTHGVGHCRDCGYQARAYHFDVGPIKRFEAVLPYHPDELMTEAERAAKEEVGTAVRS